MLIFLFQDCSFGFMELPKTGNVEFCFVFIVKYVLWYRDALISVWILEVLCI